MTAGKSNYNEQEGLDPAFTVVLAPTTDPEATGTDS